MAELPETAVSRVIDRWVERIGDAISWLWPALLVVIVLNVVLRYALGEGRIEFEEIQWHIYAVGFLIGLSYAFRFDAHIRVDVLHERFSPVTRAWIDLYGIILFVLPFVALMLIYGVPFVVDSFRTGEVSPSPGGLPLRWVIKSALLVGFALLGLAAFSRLSRLWRFLFFQTRDAN